MENQKTIALLNQFISINNDRIEVYETMARETDEQELINMFKKFVQTSKHCKQQLILEVFKLGGLLIENKIRSGVFYNVWNDIDTVLKRTARKAILNSCEYGEDLARGNYQMVLDNYLEQLSIEQQRLLKTQYRMLNADFEEIKSIR
jgi:uncharacterized protein (TIGR02284 family)